MNGVEALEAIKAFEARHDVTAYQVDGWHVWPLVRVLLGFKAFPRKAPGVLKRAWSGAARPLAGYVRAQIRRAIRKPEERTVDEAAASVVFLTPSGRRVWWGEKFYEIYTDPLVEMLQAMGEKAVVWELGVRKMPQHFPSRSMLPELIDQLYRSAAHFRRIPEPEWFSQLQPLFKEVVGRSLMWGELAHHIVLVSEMALIFERHLKRLRPKVVIAVCWYSNRTMALNLAAQRLGIRTVDLQHGVQGRGHFAYAGWAQTPASGYGVLPDVFWVWGRDAAKDLLAHNPGWAERVRILIGGNPWLNKWRPDGGQAAAPDPTSRRILVTLQHDISVALLEAVRRSPPSWRWMFRFHPGRPAKLREADRAQLAATEHSGIEWDRPSAALLYELLQACDVHVTESSTCALEALAFGVGTVILEDTELGRIGAFYYRAYFESGVMQLATSAEDVIAMIQSMPALEPGSEVASMYFADKTAGVHALRQLLDI